MRLFKRKPRIKKTRKRCPIYNTEMVDDGNGMKFYECPNDDYIPED